MLGLEDSQALPPLSKIDTPAATDLRSVSHVAKCNRPDQQKATLTGQPKVGAEEFLSA